MIQQIFRQFFGHSFGKRCHQNTFVFVTSLQYFGQKIVYLVLARTHNNLWVQQSRWSNQLFNHHAFGLSKFVVGRCCRHIYHLIDKAMKLFKPKRTVVESSRQAETKLNKVLLSRPITPIHAAKLRNANMTFVDNHQIIFWEKIEQAIRTLARLAAIEIARVVLDARTVPQLFHHLHVILHPFLNTLGLNAVAKLVKEINLLNQIVLNTAYGMLRLVFRGDEKVGGIYLIIVKTINAMIS